jgi:hypothetical protein
MKKNAQQLIPLIALKSQNTKTRRSFSASNLSMDFVVPLTYTVQKKDDKVGVRALGFSPVPKTAYPFGRGSGIPELDGLLPMQAGYNTLKET